MNHLSDYDIFKIITDLEIKMQLSHVGDAAMSGDFYEIVMYERNVCFQQVLSKHTILKKQKYFYSNNSANCAINTVQIKCCLYFCRCFVQVYVSTDI